MKILAGILGGLMLTILSTFVVTVAFATSEPGGGIGVLAFFARWVVGKCIALTAPRAAKAWRRLLLTCAVLSFLLPISGLVFTGSYMAGMGSIGEHSTAVAAIGGTLVSGVLGFVGFFIGISFLVTGLLVGREKQEVYVELPSGTPLPRA